MPNTKKSHYQTALGSYMGKPIAVSCRLIDHFPTCGEETEVLDLTTMTWSDAEPFRFVE